MKALFIMGIEEKHAPPPGILDWSSSNISPELLHQFTGGQLGELGCLRMTAGSSSEKVNLPNMIWIRFLLMIWKITKTRIRRIGNH